MPPSIVYRAYGERKGGIGERKKKKKDKKGGNDEGFEIMRR
jgi:hypothetical protein